jgi:hypothetical protein
MPDLLNKTIKPTSRSDRWNQSALEAQHKYNRCCETNKLNVQKKEIVIIANDTIKVK